jgi:hypothetical protein
MQELEVDEVERLDGVAFFDHAGDAARENGGGEKVSR